VELAETLLEAGSAEELVRALQCRLIIGLGLGIAMERHQLDEDEAMQFLAVDASTRSVSLQEAAQRLVDRCNAESGPLDPYGLTAHRGMRCPIGGAERTA
jgi:hypothetical protein